jgi:hypothetical protein
MKERAELLPGLSCASGYPKTGGRSSEIFPDVSRSLDIGLRMQHELALPIASRGDNRWSISHCQF